MWRAKRREGFAAVTRFEEAFSAGVDHIRVRRIGAKRRVVKRSLNQRALRVDQRPRLAGVFGTIKATAGLGFDECVNSIGICRRYSKIAFADQLIRKAVRDLREMLATVSALVEPTFTRAADDRPRFALETRHPCVNNTRIAWLHLDIHRTNSVRYKEDFAPRLPAVSCFENTALIV